jgi:steroid 5-alpha reductase family enzyme
VTTLFITTAGVVMAAMVALWIVSLFARDASIVDIFWGPAFAVVSWTSHVVTGNDSARAWAICIMATAWGLRLALHLAARNLGHGEDRRYQAMREHHGARFPLISLATVFLLQGALVCVISLPLQAVHALGAGVDLGWLDIAGIGLWATGLGFEATADAQLTRFKRSPANKGKVMDRGLWRYSRHPNYFGDFLLWWGFGLTALAAGAWWALAGPIVMSVLLMRVSGVTLLESTIVERRPAYRLYMERTSAFFPRRPRT